MEVHRFVLGLMFVSATAMSGQEKQREYHDVANATQNVSKNSILRQMVVSSQNFEVGDTWDGLIAAPQICSGAWYANAPATPPPGVKHPDYAHQINLRVEWGDGKADEVNLTSDHLTDNPALGHAPGKIIGRHQYTTEVDPPKPIMVRMVALCITMQGQGWDRVDNSCSNSSPDCTPYPASVGVYKSVEPSTVAVSRSVVGGQIALGALAINLIRSAPPSGTKIKVSSNNPHILFPQPTGPPKQTTIVTIPAGQNAASFHIDATAAKRNEKFKITAINSAIATPITTQDIAVE
jgi:hypothetical protein